jgi:hypothetical protein
MTTNINAKPKKVWVAWMSPREKSLTGMNGGRVRATARLEDGVRAGTVGRAERTEGSVLRAGRFSVESEDVFGLDVVGSWFVETLSWFARAMFALKPHQPIPIS